MPLSARSQSHALPVWSPSEDFFCLDSRRDLKNLTTERQSLSGPKKTTLLPVESGVISTESEYLCMGNGCFKLLSTNNHHVSFRHEESALSIPCRCCGNCHYCPQSLWLTTEGKKGLCKFFFFNNGKDMLDFIYYLPTASANKVLIQGWDL